MKDFLEKMKPVIMKSIIFNDIAIQLLDVLGASHDKDWKVDTHRHPWFEFNYVESGSSYTTIKGKEFLVNAGQSYLIPPGVLHSHRNHNYMGDDGICIRWQFHKIDETDICFDTVNRAFSHLKAYPFASDIESIPLCDNHLSNQAAFLAWIFRLYDIFSEDIYIPKPENNISHQVILYLNEYYSRKIRVKELSDVLNISYRNLSRVFVKQTGVTIIGKLNEIRINQAKKLLLETDMPVYEIARKAGFDNEYYFSNTFKQYTYYSPLQFRKIMQNK